MKKIYLLSILLSHILLATDEEIAKEVPEALLGIGNSWTPSVQVAKTYYTLSVDGNEVFRRSIVYDIVEGTAGLSKNYENFSFGVYIKKSIDELESGSVVEATGKPDVADIDREEFIMALRYKDSLTSSTTNTSSISYGLMFYKSSLDAQNRYEISEKLTKNYHYDTEGINLSATYNFAPDTKGSKFFFRTGLLFTHADLDFDEYKDGKKSNQYVDDSVNMLGVNLATGYNWQIHNNWLLTFFGSYNYMGFGKVQISGEAQSQLAENDFSESTYSLGTGVMYVF